MRDVHAGRAASTAARSARSCAWPSARVALVSSSGLHPWGVHRSPPSGAGGSFHLAPRYPASSDRVVAWLVLALLLACGTLALYDTFLLLAGLASG